MRPEIIKGWSGRIEIFPRRVGEPIKLTVFDAKGESIYFNIDPVAICLWEEAFALRPRGQPLELYAGRAVLRVTVVGRQEDRFLEAYDLYSPEQRLFAKFDKNQAPGIAVILRRTI